MNLISGKATAEGVKVGDYVVPVSREILAKASGETDLTIGIRPEHLAPSESGQGVAVDVAVVEPDTYSLLVGGLFMVIVDDLARTLTPTEIPLGILTALIGAPVFAVLLLRAPRAERGHG